MLTLHLAILTIDVREKSLKCHSDLKVNIGGNRLIHIFVIGRLISLFSQRIILTNE